MHSCIHACICVQLLMYCQPGGLGAYLYIWESKCKIRIKTFVFETRTTVSQDVQT